ncbi:MAG: toprim domain-containing protein [Bdellovibrionota bacterium]
MGEDFARIKREVPLLELIEKDAGIPVHKKYSGYVHLEECPFCGGHECFTVYEDHYKCFQCEAAGDAVTFAQRHRMLDSPLAALKALAGEYGVPLEGGDAGGSEAPRTITDSPHNRIFERAADYYHQNLFADRNSGALRHLVEVRGHKAGLLEEFQVGLTDGGLHRALASEFGREELLASGLVKESGAGLGDAFPPGLFVYPHFLSNGLIGDFTCKPLSQERTPLRLRSEFRAPGCLFWNQVALDASEIVLVEGQNDALSVIGKGGFKNTLALCGQITNEQLALLKEIAPRKTIYLAFDADEAGRRYTQKVLEALRPLPRRLAELLGEERADVRLVTWPEDSKSPCKDVDEYLRSQKNPEASFGILLEQATPLYEPLRKCLGIYRSHCADRKFNFFSPDAAKNQATMIWQWLGSERAFFVEKSGLERCFLTHRGKVYPLGASPAFRALIYELADIVYSEPRAKVIFDALECQCLLAGRRIDVAPWLYLEEGALYLHTARPDDAVLKIEPGSVSIIPNARVSLLRPSNKMKPIEFDPDVDVQRAFADLERLFLSNLSTDPANRYFTLCWLLSIFLMPFSHDRAVVHMGGTAASGKTTAANLCSVLLYGEDWVGKSRTASDFADGMVNPLTIKDNLENRDIDTGTYNFLLAAATGTVNQKRKGGTDSENVHERLYNQVIVTAIDPLDRDRNDLLSRTWCMEFGSKYRSPAFQKTSVMEALKEKRSQILSAFLLVLAREILPQWKERKGFYLELQRLHYPGHPKHRLDEFLAGLFTVLETILKYLPDTRRPKLKDNPRKAAQELIEEMLRGQEEKAREAEAHSNPVLVFLETLVKELLHARSYQAFQEEFKLGCEVEPVTGTPAKVAFFGKTTTFHTTFSHLARQRGLYNPFPTAQQLGARIRDSEEILKRNGWTVRRLASRGIRRFHFGREIEEEDL